MNPCGKKLSLRGTKGARSKLIIFLLVPDIGTLYPATLGTKPRMHLG